MVAGSGPSFPIAPWRRSSRSGLGSPASMLRRLPRRVCRGRNCYRGGLGVAIVDLEEIGAFAAFRRYSPLAVVADPLRPKCRDNRWVGVCSSFCTRESIAAFARGRKW
ncbi:hypothetical protein BHE74_00045714 [Ensete ventricosum]|nr:hypothetical protein BHE74_00045714 [Ensete ventricosum]